MFFKNRYKNNSVDRSENEKILIKALIRILELEETTYTVNGSDWDEPRTIIGIDRTKDAKIIALKALSATGNK
jgi:hypothetical protein